ncbi:DEAD/DEAH box helicase [Corynebacterium sp. H130]|uniref:DEAD/DEAH box helicase n=1 Tax=Corynebacterium sp. H130 TaxID=3133444 RepID=UPI0030A6D183
MKGAWHSNLIDDVIHGFVDREHDSHQVFDPRLIANANENETMLAAIQHELHNCSSFKFSIAFISASGLSFLRETLREFPGRGTIVTSRYLDFNEPNLFRELLEIENLDVFIYDHPHAGFHAKGYIFENSPFLTAIIGSSNLTAKALVANQEWNIRFSTQESGSIAFQISDAIDRQLQHCVPLTEEWIQQYESERKTLVREAVIDLSDETSLQQDTIEPNAMQVEALKSLNELVELGQKRAIIVSATGTGKTILAALAAKQFNPEKVLFVVHREQIAKNALQEFQKVFGLPESEFGRFTQNIRQLDRRFVFATSQTLSKPATLASIDPEFFDYIIIDESHHSGAKTFRSIIDHFKPKFLLGLTATPERTDSINIYELFDYNLAYEIRLQRALEAGLLAPFHYYGVSDFTRNSVTSDETSDLAFLVSEERVKFVAEKMQKYGWADNVKGLIFCSRKDEARELSQLFNKKRVFGKLLRTAVLTGEDSASVREATVRELEEGRLDYILTVDIFNEGIDIPCLNQIVMLRPTQSSIIFTQQLGRGLRQYRGKEHLQVIDFIGNYANNFMIPIALYDRKSRRKEDLRKMVIERKSIAGLSSVNFDEVSKERVLRSISAAKLDSIAELKKDINQFKDAHGRLPKLIDFASLDLTDPVIMATTKDSPNYWSLLHRLKFVESKPSDSQRRYLNFLSGELLNGKRPHELIALQKLLSEKKASAADLKRAISRQAVESDDSTFESVLRMLTFEFLTSQQKTEKKYGADPVLVRDGANWVLHPDFENSYFAKDNSEFRSHVDDIIETGLFLSRERYSLSNTFTIGQRYSRKDVCRLLNWEGNYEGIVYGYKCDLATHSCPIFVTYHKGPDVESSVNYDDQFIDQSTLLWNSRSNRTLKSKDVAPIVNGDVDVHVFVKKDDGEGTDFYYLGTALPTNVREGTMSGKEGEGLSVVRMDLKLEHEVDRELYDYLETPSSE